MAALRRSQTLSQGNYLLLAKTYGLVMVIILVVYGVMAGIASAFRDQQQVVQALLILGLSARFVWRKRPAR